LIVTNRDHGRLDVMVNDIFDGGRYAEFAIPMPSPAILFFRC